MNMAEIMESVGKVAGIGGLSIGLVLIIFRQVILKNMEVIDRKRAYRLLRLTVILTWSIAVLGLVLWATPTFIIGNGNVVQTKK